MEGLKDLSQEPCRKNEHCEWCGTDCVDLNEGVARAGRECGERFSDGDEFGAGRV